MVNDMQPGAIAVPTLNELREKHPLWQQESDYWQTLWALSTGGKEVTPDVRARLLANPDGRSGEARKERVKLSQYHNYIGPAFTRLLNRLFEHPPVYSGGSDPFWQEFFEAGAVLWESKDGRWSFNGFLSNAMRDALTMQAAIAVVDKPSGSAANLQEYQDANLDRPYVALLPRWALWDWDEGSPLTDGLVFAKIYSCHYSKTTWQAARTFTHTFTIYQRAGDRDTDPVYLSVYNVTPSDTFKGDAALFADLDRLEAKDATIAPAMLPNGMPLVNLPAPSLDGRYPFPVAILGLERNLWIANELYETVKADFNVRSGTLWSMVNALYEMPVVIEPEKMPRDENGQSVALIDGQTFGDGFYLQLPYGSQITTLKTSSDAVPRGMDFLDKQIRRDAFDTLQQIAASVASSPSALSRSGLSKALDLQPEMLMMLAFGDRVRHFARKILAIASAFRNERIEWQIGGLDSFGGEGLIQFIADYKEVATANLQSPTLLKEARKNVARAYAKAYRLPQATLETAIAEIDGAPVDESTLPLDAPKPAPIAGDSEAGDRDEPTEETDTLTE